MTAPVPPLMYGPEVWLADDAGVEWTYWDLWYAALCVRDHGGDWDGLDAAVARLNRSDGAEARWSHLLDLRERLDAAGLSAAELVADAIKQKGVFPRARDRVFKQSLSWRQMTPAMRNPPSLRLENRARHGWWPRFPNSPQEPHDLLVARFRLDPVPDRYGTDGWAAGKLADKVAEAAEALEFGDGARTLAVRRAMLTICLDLAQCCDDSYGHVGEMINLAIEVYAGTDWRAAGLAPEVFWADFLEIFTMLTNYGIASGQETEILRAAGAATDLDVLRDIAAGLHAEYTAARMAWHADAVQALSVHALVAALALEEFEAAARRLGSEGWRTWDVMVTAA